MSNTNYTAAPWRIEGQDIIGNEVNGYICTCSGKPANKKLIAAAPEMLDALIYAWENPNDIFILNQKIEAAIKKATI